MDKQFEEEHTNMTKEELDKAWEDTDYRIRKLTPKECGRLMDVEDKSIDKILSTVSNTQAYRVFGNSICVTVLCAVFSQLNIKNVIPWNERSLDEKYKLTALERNHERRERVST